MQYCRLYMWLYAHFLKQKRGTELLVIRLLAHHKPSHTMRAVCAIYGTNSSMCVKYSSSIYTEVVIQRRKSWYVYVNVCAMNATPDKSMQNLNKISVEKKIYLKEDLKSSMRDLLARRMRYSPLERSRYFSTAVSNVFIMSLSLHRKSVMPFL